MDEDLTPLSEATSPEEFKQLREAHRKASAEPAGEKTPQAAEATPVIAAEPGTAKQAQETVEPPAEKSAEEQIKELRKAGKHAAANKLMVDSAVKAEKERADKLHSELETLRSRPAAEPQKPEAKPEAAQPAKAAAADDPEPQSTDEKYAGANGYEKYLRDVTRWEVRAENRQTEQRRQQSTVHESTQKKVQAAKAKYQDFDAATAADMKAGTGLILTPQMQQFVLESDSGMDVAYHLGKNPDDYARIFVMPPVRQIAELGKLEAKLEAKLATPPAAAQAAAPVVLKPAVSRVAAPPRVLTGSETPEPKGTSEARDYDEFKHIRKSLRAS